MKTQSRNGLFIRSFVFGVEDSLVSTVGLLAGVAIAAIPRQTILITGVVLIFVEAFSMAVGNFLSEHSAEEYEKQTDVPVRLPLKSAFIMFASYFTSGFIPLSPYIILETRTAFWVSIVLSLFALFVLGIVRAKISKLALFKHGFEMFFVGGVAILIGIATGKLMSY